MDYYSPRSSPELDLTPRSKIKALLAAFDDDSDKENEAASPTNPQHRHLGQVTPQRNKTSPAPEKRQTLPLETRSTLARESESRSKSPVDRPGAYARIREQLLKPNEPPRVPISDTASSAPGAEHSATGSETFTQKRKRTEDAAGDTETPQSPLILRDRSPGLFVSPSRPDVGASSPSREDSSDDDLPDLSAASKRLRELVARKRAERIAKERAARDMPSESELEGALDQNVTNTKRLRVILESESDGDEAAAEKLTQQARPTRKASKKAIEEINRETQRLSRNMQLTHEARTRTKFSTADFFAKFNFRQSVSEDPQPAKNMSEDASSSSDPQSPDVDRANVDTPPTSPPSAAKMPRNDEADDRYKDKDQSKANTSTDLVDVASATDSASSQKQIPELRYNNQIALSARMSTRIRQTSSHLMEDSGDELEISPPRHASRLDIFNRLAHPAKRDSRSIQTLRVLAHIGSPGTKRKSEKKSLSVAELQLSLRRRAREQAIVEKAEKIQALRDKGVIIQTAEEKERDQLELESLVEKARKEAEELQKKEKEDAKKNGKVEESHLPDSDDDDEDWDDGAEGEAELSGSDDDQSMAEVDAEDENDEEEASEDGRDLSSNAVRTGLFDTEASDADSEGEAESDDSEHENDVENDRTAETTPKTHQIPRASRRKTIIVADDEDDEVVIHAENTETANIKLPVTPKPTIMNAFGFATDSSGPLGLTQMFAGSMSDSQTQTPHAFATAASPSIPLSFPSPLNPPLRRYDTGESDDFVIPNSQLARQNSGEESLSRLAETPLRETQDFELPEPTQDIGFQPLAEDPPVASYSTVATVPLMTEEPHKRRGIRRGRAPAEEDQNAAPLETDMHSDAFAFMRNANVKAAAVADFDKKRSKAKQMVEEQAEESEDEYAGLGGASDDESQGELDDDTKRMIDDDSNEVADEQQNAALFADRERAEDEKRVEKLFKDINGGWRRKRGADLDFSDDDDDGAARRRAKQREFARMRRALLADEKLGKIAENPKQQAFLKAIEDRDGDEDMDLLEETQESQPEESQPQDTIKGPSVGEDAQQAEGRNPAQRDVHQSHRPGRAHGFTKPSSLTQIRSVLSEMIGESETVLASQDDSESSDSEVSVNDELDILDEADGPDAAPEAEAVATMAPPAFIPPGLRRHRTAPSASRGPVVDRKVLKRSASNVSLLNNDATSVKPAFFAPSLARSNSMRPPSLLRRATTNSSASSEGGGPLSRTVSVNSASGSEDRGKETVRTTGGPKRSSVNWYARENERKARVETFERERAEGRERVGQMRRDCMSAGLGIVGVGSFDN